MRTDKNIIWLLQGDVSIQYQTHRDLLGVEKPTLRKRIATEGWGAAFLSCRHEDGHWGQAFYQPKWTSSHYTLLDLKNLALTPNHTLIKASLKKIFETEKGADGGIGPFGKKQLTDVCINGMVLNYASYFKVPEEFLKSIVDYILDHRMPDGGFNCRINTSGASHSSLHTSLSILEGLEEYRKNRYRYRLNELVQVKASAEEFILMHRLFRSDKTGNIINPSFLRMYYPCRWYYDVLRAMDYFQSAEVPYDVRMEEALQLIKKKANKDGLWTVPSKHAGKTHFDMEPAGKPSRWNTLRALRVLLRYDKSSVVG